MAQDSIDSNFNRLQLHDDADRLIIGLDFGTTYSGIAYGFSSSHKGGPIAILEWPGAKGRTFMKAPTTIRYDDHDKKSFKWGYELDQYGSEKIEGIKLLLDPEQTKPLYVPTTDTKAELQKLGKPPVEVASDYIGAIYKHAMNKIEKQWPADFLSMLQKKFILSVPAVWSDKAKDSTLRAARQAGIHNVDLIKEPEAAALYTLHDVKDKALKIGDAFVVCDAGGGTVDLISYEITKLDPLELRELVPGTGKLAHYSQLFADILEVAVGKEQFIELRNTEGFRFAMRQFDESIKPGFNPFEDPDADPKITIPFPNANLKDDPTNFIKSNCYTLTNDTLCKIFQPLVDDIRNLVKDQVNCVKIKRMEEQRPNATEVKAIFLVGGFGASNYLRECLQQANPNIQIIQPHDAWSAIVKGAVLSQLPQEQTATVTTTIAARHYGVCALSPVEAGDEAQPVVWDSFKERNRVLKLTWMTYAKGDDIQRDQEIKFPFYRSIKQDYTENDLIFEDELIESDAVNPPKYPGVTKTNCTLTADFHNVPSAQFHHEVDKHGRPYYEVHYDLVVKLKAASMKFSAQINGKDMGSVEVKYG
ncbi:Hsp70 family protein-like protein [Tricladium varicosporioides]|nr:Hsp70 family protein-like protein [Hymenoscyphus varicosporioides]